MSAAAWASVLGLGISLVLLALSGILEVSLNLHTPAFVQKMQHVPSRSQRHAPSVLESALPVDAPTHRRLQSRGLQYSIYTGADRADRDMAQIRDHATSRQIERALERVRALEKGAGTQVLENLLVAYKTRHAHCLNSTTLPPPYVLMSMVDEYAGLGNQFPGIITGFLLALITERCLFIDFPLYHKLFAPDLDFSWERHAARLRAGFGHDVNATAPRELKFWKGEDVSAWLMHDQRALYAADYGIMLKNDPDYTGALLQANPFHRDFLRRAFPTGEMFQALAHFLLKVRPDLEAQVQEFKRKHFRPVTIGLQIRRLKCDGWEGSIHCEQLPVVENFAAVAQMLQHARGLDDSEVRVFVGADQPESYQKVIAALGEDMVIYRRDNGVGTVKTKVIGVNNPSTPESALIDMRLLSECSELVITVASSYGSVAAAWGGIAPVQMLHGLHKNVQNPYWYKAITSEPCYWKGQIFLNSKDPFWGKIGANETAQLKSNPFWMQYTQCHCAS